MYRVNEIFYSLQGEGLWTGTPMVFVRFSGCNLKCPFCDTDHSGYREMSAEEIVAEAKQVGGPCTIVCLTGGEPLMQVDDDLVDVLHETGFSVHVETNGTCHLPNEAIIDWVTFSPKSDFVKGGKIVIEEVSEVKVVFREAFGEADRSLREAQIERWARIHAEDHSLQPCDTGDPEKNRELLAETIDYIMRHPHWRLSLQTHKLLKIR